MRLFDDDEDGDDGDIVFRDLIMLTLTGFVTVAVLILPHINPRAAAETAQDTAPPGNVMIEANWPSDLDTDVDLWVQAPGDNPVGYSNKGGAVFNLLRDDLGHMLDVSGLNYESSFSRGIVGGEYTVNLHLYRNRAATITIPVTVVVSVKAGADLPARQLLVSRLALGREGEERTVFRFRLSEAGTLVPGSVTSLQRPLRSGSKA
jgi:hypothetical protein